jgi:ABC-type polysaccharide/polyol phosphate export permease
MPGPRHAPARWLALVVDDLRQLRRFWPVVQNMVVQELRVRYQRSMLGFFWTLLNPILMMVTLTVVFSQLMKQQTFDYAKYLFAGMVPWGLLNGSLNECAFCIIHNEGLIRKIFLPKLIFPLARVLINLTTLVLSMVALFILLIPLGARFTAPMLFLPVAIVLFTAFTLGLGLIVATMNTFYRDCGHLVSVFLQAWYFATPVIYYADMLPPEKQRWFWLNPAYPFIRIFQETIRFGQWPDLTTILVAAGLATVSLGVGYAAFKSYEDKLVFRL